MEITLQGFTQLERKLNARGVIDYRPLLQGIGALTERQTLDRFEAERDPSGRPWRPLAASTVLHKLGGSRKAYGKRGRMTAKARRRLGAIKILQEAGHDGGLVDTVSWQVQGGQVMTGVNKVYAAIHQFGGAGVGKPGIPAREYLGFGPQDIHEIEQEAARWLLGQLGA
jgi:phage virion morphogenesis protein